jgi:hypothetical protein
MLSHFLRATPKIKPTVSFVARYGISTSATTQNYGTVNIGTADPTRMLVLITEGFSGTAGRFYNGASVGGVSATVLQNPTTSNNDSYAIMIATVPYPTGTTANLTTTCTANLGSFQTTHVFAIYNLTSYTAFHSNSATTGTGTASSISTTLNIPSNGVAIGVSTAINATTLTNLTSYLTYSDSSNDINIGLDLYLPSETGRTITATHGTVARIALAVASWA